MTIETLSAPDHVVQSQPEKQFINKRLRLASMFVIIGMVIEGLSLVWNHPLSFLAFTGIGGLALAVGVIVYLLALVSRGQDS